MKKGTKRAETAWRVTNAQRAAVCGLMLAGETFTMSCMVVGVPYAPMRREMPLDWLANKGRTPRPRKVRGALDELEEAYRDRKVPLSTLAEAFGCSASWIRRLARRHGWRARKPRLPAMTAEQRRDYRKIRPTLGRDRALNHVLRSAA